MFRVILRQTLSRLGKEPCDDSLTFPGLDVSLAFISTEIKYERRYSSLKKLCLANF